MSVNQNSVNVNSLFNQAIGRSNDPDIDPAIKAYIDAAIASVLAEVNEKQDAPADTGTAGQVLGLDSELDPVWMNQSGGSGAVDDVQINETSIVDNGIANIPLASSSNLGVVKTDIDRGIDAESSGKLLIRAAGDTSIKTGSGSYQPIVPTTQHRAAFYGLAKAAGDTTQALSANAVGEYTSDAKQAIQKMLGVGNNWELINTAEITEDAQSIVITTDSNGQPFRISHYAFILTAKGSAETTSNTNLYVKLNPDIYCGYLQGIIRSSDTNVAGTGQIIINATASGQINYQTLIGPSVNYNSPTNAQTLPSTLKTYADYFELYVTGTAKLGANSVVNLFGIRC